MLSASAKVELAIRAGHLAKCALELTSAQSALVARAQLVAVAKQIRELDEFIREAELGAKA
jgi:hypothetical protein